MCPKLSIQLMEGSLKEGKALCESAWGQSSPTFLVKAVSLWQPAASAPTSPTTPHWCGSSPRDWSTPPCPPTTGTSYHRWSPDRSSSSRYPGQHRLAHLQHGHLTIIFKYICHHTAMKPLDFFVPARAIAVGDRRPPPQAPSSPRRHWRPTRKLLSEKPVLSC